MKRSLLAQTVKAAALTMAVVAVVVVLEPRMRSPAQHDYAASRKSQGQLFRMTGALQRQIV